MNISIAIQHSPARADLAARLVADLGGRLPVDLVADPAPPPPGTHPTSALWSPWRTYRHCLETTPADATHRLIVQDDALVCADFTAAATAALAAQPDRVVTFYVGGNARLAAARVVHAAGQGRSWAVINHYSWIPAVALAWPARLIPPLLAYCDRHRWTATFRSDDELLGRFLRTTGEPLYATVPSLVDHPDDVPSLIGTRHRGGRDKGRIAACWVGDCDASAIDWT